MLSQIQFTRILLLISAIALCGCHALQRTSNSSDILVAASTATPDTNNPTAPAGTTGRNPTMVSQILEARCTSCHTDSGKPENGINYITDLARLQTQGFIVAGNSKDSEVFKASQGMGAPCTSPRISDEELAEIADYIDALK